MEPPKSLSGASVDRGIAMRHAKAQVVDLQEQPASTEVRRDRAEVGPLLLSGSLVVLEGSVGGGVGGVGGGRLTATDFTPRLETASMPWPGRRTAKSGLSCT